MLKEFQGQVLRGKDVKILFCFNVLLVILWKNSPLYIGQLNKCKKNNKKAQLQYFFLIILVHILSLFNSNNIKALQGWLNVNFFLLSLWESSLFCSKFPSWTRHYYAFRHSYMTHGTKVVNHTFRLPKALVVWTVWCFEKHRIGKHFRQQLLFKYKTCPWTDNVFSTTARHSFHV